MSYEVLYRKYRPSTWEEVKGQELVVKTLQKQLLEEKIGHAYLFHGSRGTGKTTVARIFASALGCFPEDIYEIDAASHRQVEDIRQIRESVQTLPFRSPYKVYILDEVHMLSGTAFNSLLKTLEEPPAHVIFILATTDMHKIPETIISRVQVCTFVPPSVAVLVGILVVAAEKEGYLLAPDAGQLLATLGKGAFRDAYGILEKVLILSEKGNPISCDAILTAIGLPSVVVLEDLVYGCIAKDQELVQKSLALVLETTRDGLLVLDTVADILRSLLYFKLHGFDTSILPHLAYPISAQLAERACALPRTVLVSDDLLSLLELTKKTQYSYDTRTGIEIFVYRYFES